MGGGIKIMEQFIVDKIAGLIQLLNDCVAVPVGIYDVMGDGIGSRLAMFIHGGQFDEWIFILIGKDIAQALVGFFIRLLEITEIFLNLIIFLNAALGQGV